MDSRHQKRIKIVQELYALSFNSDKNLFTADKKTQSIIKNKVEINKEIEKFAAKFPLDKIAKIDLAILQLSIYELTFEKKEPPKVIINEAVELAKEFGSPRSFAFINAVLGKVFKENYKIN